MVMKLRFPEVIVDVDDEEVDVVEEVVRDDVDVVDVVVGEEPDMLIVSEPLPLKWM